MNGQRLTGSGAFRNVGIRCCSTPSPINAPYVFEVIGNPGTLPANLLSTSAGARWYALKDSLGFRFDVTNGGTMTLPAAPTALVALGAPLTDEEPRRTHAGGQRLMIAALGLLVGVILGLIFTPDVPAGLDPYLPIAVVAALDAVFGALRAYLEGIFDDKVFVVSFFSNVVIAAAIVFLGDKLGVGGQLSTGVIVVLGIRIFSNVAQIRRYIFHA